MDLSWLESLLLGIVSGLAEILPVSAQAHQTLLLRLFGVSEENALMSLLIHAGVLLALWMACKPQINQIRREQKLAKTSKRRRKRQPDAKTLLDFQIVKLAFLPILIGFLLYPAAQNWSSNLILVAVFLILNGLILYLPDHLPSGNKDSRSMSRLDALLMGVCGALAMLPGISRVGMTTSVALVRGADKQQALNWSFLLSLPVLLCFMGMDVYGIVLQGAGGLGFLVLLQYIFSAAAAFCGAYAAIIFMRFLAVSLGFSSFAYYTWGAALFAFILYMTI